MNYLIASHHEWNKESYNNLQKKIGSEHKLFFIKDKRELNLKFLEKIKPRYIFFPHWSFIVPENIIKKYECVCFHMTDLPYGRGGSPLQNLIIRGHKKTKISALRMVNELDAGPIYFKRSLSLNGSAQKIYSSCSKKISKMIESLIKKEPIPKEQIGKVTYFDRRNPGQSEIKDFKNISGLYDFIRMLDADGYPNAYLEDNNFRYEFFSAKIENDHLSSSVRIIKKKKS
ncbi:MAG: methionyl-tRNA formyltransferase [Rickettsiales bacterium]|nr:methionyl-tRNA formyltransferase [Rickettsiales bacterium]